MTLSVTYPNQNRNYCTFDTGRVNSIVAKKEQALPEIEAALKNPKNEDEIIIYLYILNLLLDNGADKKAVANIYPTLSKYNYTK